MFDGDYVWLLKTLSNSNIDLNSTYGTNLRFPEIACLKSGEPKIWFYTHQNKIKIRNENYLKLKFIKDYFAFPSILNDKDELTHLEDDEDHFKGNDNKILCYVYLNNQQKNLRVIKKLRNGVANLLFTKNETSEYCTSWSKMISYIPHKNAALFEGFLTKGEKGEAKIKVTKNDFPARDIESEEFMGKIRVSPLDIKSSTAIYKSNNEKANKVISDCLITIARFLEGKTQKKIGSLSLELIIDDSGAAWLIGCPKGIYFLDYDGNIDTTLDKDSMIIPKKTIQEIFHCPGAYCNFTPDRSFDPYYQEGDDMKELFTKIVHM